MKLYKHRRLLFKIAAVLFIVELVLSAFITFALNEFSPIVKILINVIILTLLSTPVICFYVIRPYTKDHDYEKNKLLDAKQQAEIDAETIKKYQQDLSAQKSAMDEHSLVSITDIRGIITYVNAKFCTISGYSREELVGQSHSILNSKNQQKDYWREMYLTASKGVPWHDEVKNQAKNGEFYWVDTTIVPLFDQGKVSGYISIRTDISKQKENITNLAQAKIDAEVANESKSEFLANMSHEIRTPMNGVIGMTNLLLDTQLDRDQIRFAKTVKNSAESLLYIINDILDFSKIESGMMEIEAINFNLGNMLEDIGSTMYHLADNKGIDLMCPASPVANLWLKTDPGRVRQILTNLISNAIKFTDQGEVAVYVSFEEQQDGRRIVRFEVTDSGIGIERAQQDTLFAKFTQADNSTTRQYGGTGLGLSISKKLVELFGGEIGIISRKGTGSTFWFTIDVEKGVGEPRMLVADLHQQKILIVDANRINQELMHQLLSLWQIDHLIVGSEDDALALLNSASKTDKPFTIAVLDMNNHGIDGIELSKKIKTNSALNEVKLVLITSLARRGDAKHMHDLGFSGYLTKPIQQSELYTVLQQVSGLIEQDETLVTRYTQQEQYEFNAHILVVEDNITNQKVIEGMLSKFAITIDLAGNGQEALAALQLGTNYDLIFMDCQMPIMDGYTATQKIRDPVNNITNHRIPIIAMTANVMRGDKEKCLAVGMNDYVAKPIDLDKLRHILEQWIAKKHMHPKSLPEPIKHSKDNQSPAEEAAELVFDYAALDAMLMGDKQLIKTISEAFYQDMTQQLEQLKVTLEQDDLGQAASLFHKIKGAAANIGGRALSATAAEMEKAAKAQDTKKLAQGLKTLVNNFDTLKTEMEKQLS